MYIEQSAWKFNLINLILVTKNKLEYNEVDYISTLY